MFKELTYRQTLKVVGGAKTLITQDWKNQEAHVQGYQAAVGIGLIGSFCSLPIIPNAGVFPWIGIGLSFSLFGYGLGYSATQISLYPYKNNTYYDVHKNNFVEIRE